MGERFQKFAGFALGLLVLASCGRSDLKDVALLGDLRVLAMVINTPEVAPGATVNVTPFVTDLNGGGRTLTYSAESCIDPGLANGAELTCAGRPDRLILATDVALPLAGPNYTDVAPTLAVTVPANILDNRGPIVAANGYAYLVFYTVKAADGATARAFKRIFASTRTPKNQNPTIAGLTIDGAAPTTLPTGAPKLLLSLAPGSIETFTQLDTTGAPLSKTEEPLVSWYVTDGELERAQDIVTESIEWTTPTSAPAGRNVQLIAVVRDRRGGDAVFRYAFP